MKPDILYFKENYAEELTQTIYDYIDNSDDEKLKEKLIIYLVEFVSEPNTAWEKLIDILRSNTNKRFRLAALKGILYASYSTQTPDIRDEFYDFIVPKLLVILNQEELLQVRRSIFKTLFDFVDFYYDGYEKLLGLIDEPTNSQIKNF